jgi:hypothetical protein
MNQKLVNECTCHKVQVEGAAMLQGIMINLLIMICSGGKDILRPQIIWMQMSFQRNDILAINHNNSNLGIALLRIHQVIVCGYGGHQRNVDNF